MSLGNLYHLLHALPAIEAWEMPPALEQAAQQLVRSGKLRINADHTRNFVRMGFTDWDATFTARELNDAALLAQTRQKLARHVPPSQGAHGIDELLQRLRADLFKAGGVDAVKEQRVARVLVQSAHASVVQLLLRAGAEIFVSYSHNVGDLMAVHDWQTHGLANGMQATSERGLQVFVSCGGDPFFEGEQKTYTTDGFPALARMMVIGGQELGHFADLMRAGHAIVGRYSMRPEARAMRRADMAHLAGWNRAFTSPAMRQLRRAESALAFYDKRNKFSAVWAFWQLRRAVALVRFSTAPWPANLPKKLRSIPPARRGENLERFYADMLFNLSPQADAYRRSTPEAEEEIACIEAVARVPQQAIKWGHEAVRAAWPQLYRLYYGTVVPACATAAGSSGPSNKTSFFQNLSIAVRHQLRPRPDYYPERPKKR
ncbi:MAG: hypothetical protein DI582_02530 [Azospirillum brasilense]|nr:MAG: hypothetical protein DI582_02530 [Azospirillum brasilense]